MASSVPDPEWGRERALDLLTPCAAWLTERARERDFHTHLARELGSLGIIGDFPSIVGAAARVLRDAPETAFTAGLVTNVRPLSRFVRRELPEGDALERMFESYRDDRVLEHMRRFAEPHIAWALRGRDEEAASHAHTDLAQEEYASTCAVLGRIDEALGFVARSGFPETRRVGPLLVACVESFRRGDQARSLSLVERLVPDGSTDPWIRVHLAAGFLGRVPWAGYPYPDY
jgi:hypothetical protein